MNSALAELERICVETLEPQAAQVDRTGGVAPGALAALRAAGFQRLFHAVADGGLGADGPQLVRAIERVARACPNTAWATLASTMLAGNAIRALGTDAHRAKWLAGLVSGELTGCVAVNEASSGSDPTSGRSRLDPDGAGFKLFGEKSRITNATAADVALVFALAPDAAGTGRRLGVVVLDTRAKGVTTTRLESTGLRGAPWGTLSFDGVKVAAEDVIYIEPERILTTIEWGWLYISGISVGIAQAALDEAVKFTRERVAFGRPLLQLEAVNGRLAMMRTAVDGARLLATQAGAMKASGHPAARGVLGMAKVYTSQTCAQVARDALELHGAWGMHTGYAIERLHRDAICHLSAGSANLRLVEMLVAMQLGFNAFAYR